MSHKFIKRARREDLEKVFNEFATLEKNDKKYMTYKGFIFNYLNLLNKPNQECGENCSDLLASTVDVDQDGLISFEDFLASEEMLCHPKAFYNILFGIFAKGSGYVTYDSFISVMTASLRFEKIKFDKNSRLISGYFGQDKTRKLQFSEFCHFMKQFRDDYLQEAFKQVDLAGTGFIPCSEFIRIALTMRGHIIRPDVKKYFSEMCTDNNRPISFAYNTAFHGLLDDMELVKLIYLKATKDNKSMAIDKYKFFYTMQHMQHITPYEIDILFDIAGRLSNSTEISWADLHAIAPQFHFNKMRRMHQKDVVTVPGSQMQDRSAFLKMAENAYRFILGSIAGAVGVIFVYPVDLVKTRMQNQRIKIYKHGFDCFRQTLQKEGPFGLYKGLLPQLTGIAPEKALKLAVNDFVRDLFYDENGNISVPAELFAGASAGFCQDVITNPLEIVKIRLQVAGETKGESTTVTKVVKELGIRGLYRGVTACLIRDMVFSAFYFTSYAHLKKVFANEEGYNGPLSLLAAGSLAASPTIFIVTPADVIKTRMQVIPREGQTKYKGLIDCVKQVYVEEGFKAFWKGSVIRVLRSSPQFGITLLTYEILHRVFHIDFGGRVVEGSRPTEHHEDDSLPLKHQIGGYSVAGIIYHSVAAMLGLCLETPPQ